MSVWIFPWLHKDNGGSGLCLWSTGSRPAPGWPSHPTGRRTVADSPLPPGSGLWVVCNFQHPVQDSDLFLNNTTNCVSSRLSISPFRELFRALDFLNCKQLKYFLPWTWDFNPKDENWWEGCKLGRDDRGVLLLAWGLPSGHLAETVFLRWGEVQGALPLRGGTEGWTGSSTQDFPSRAGNSCFPQGPVLQLHQKPSLYSAAYFTVSRGAWIFLVCLYSSTQFFPLPTTL